MDNTVLNGLVGGLALLCCCMMLEKECGINFPLLKTDLLESIFITMLEQHTHAVCVCECVCAGRTLAFALVCVLVCVLLRESYEL